VIDLLKQNVSSIFTLLGLVLVHYVGLRMARLKDETDKKKMSMDAADGLRDDLMNRLDEANKRIDKKDELIDSLRKQNQDLDTDCARMKWQVEMKNWDVEKLNNQLKESEALISKLKKELQEKSYG
jgi:peptidoglycan hydrolase CwlO-like protein